MRSKTEQVKPLGVFGVLADQRQMEQRREELRRLVGIIPAARREEIASYLRSGHIVIALMEHARDVLGRFECPGGSGILTDGAFYWRRDAAEYVQYYGIGLPFEFLDHGERPSWRVVPRLTDEAIATIDRYLETTFRAVVRW